MKLLNLAVLFVSLTLVLPVQARICEDPLKNQKLCLKMKTFRAQIDLLDAQRDLYQADYEYMSTVGQDMYSLIDSIIGQATPSHLTALKAVRAQVGEMTELAVAKDPDTFVKSNRISESCLNCHQNTYPSSGVMWDEISSNNWNQTSQTCNLPGKNPYFCKSMHGMLTVYSYFVDSNNATVQNFSAVEKTAGEMVRMASDLAKANMVHGGTQILLDVKGEAEQLVQMAKKQDPAVFAKSASFFQSCAKCHPN